MIKRFDRLRLGAVGAFSFREGTLGKPSIVKQQAAAYHWFIEIKESREYVHDGSIKPIWRQDLENYQAAELRGDKRDRAVSSKTPMLLLA